MTPAKKSAPGVLLVDSHPLMGLGLKCVLASCRDLVYRGRFEHDENALGEIARLQPAVVLVDMTTGTTDAIAFVQQVRARSPGSIVLVYSSDAQLALVLLALRAGARGFISRDVAPDRLLHAIREVLKGVVHIPKHMEPCALEALVGQRADQTRSPLDRLTKRELQVFGLIGAGHAVRQVAAKLGIGSKTVETHCHRIKQKLHLTSVPDLRELARAWHQNPF